MIETRVHVSGIGGNTAVGVCCATMAKGLQSGTDAEGFGAFAWVAPDGTIRISSQMMPPHKFCPWCGKPPKARVGSRV